MPQTQLYGSIFRLQEWGVLDVILPFILVFTVIYAFLIKTKVLGEPSEAKRFNTIVALVFGALVVLPHVLYGGMAADGRLSGPLQGFPDVVDIINNSLPAVAAWIIGIMLLMLMIGMFGGEAFKEMKKPLSTLAVLLSGGVVLYIFLRSAGILDRPLGGFLERMVSGTSGAGLIIILVFGIIIWYVMSDEKTAAEKANPKPGIFDEWFNKGK